MGQLFVQQKAFDAEKEDFVLVDTGRDVTDVVASILSGDTLPFVIFFKPSSVDFNSNEYKREARAIIGYGGKYTFPFISDPTDHYDGAVGMLPGKLVYSRKACPLHVMRDAYRHMYAPIDHIFFLDGDFIEVVSRFTHTGLPLFSSEDMIDYELQRSFSVDKQISIEELKKQTRT